MTQTWFLICATRPEWGELKKKIAFRKDSTLSGLNFYEEEQNNKKIKLGQIGIGYKNAKQKAEILFGSMENHPKLVIHFGLAGALDSNFKEGDLIVPTKFINPSRETVPGTAPLVKKTKKLLDELKLSFQEGTLFTSDKVLNTPGKKREAGKRMNALAVDMETSPFAKICRDKKIPFLSIRAIFDPLDWELPFPDESAFFDGEGNLKKGPLLEKVITQPRLLMALPKYQKAASVGNKALARFIMAAVEKW